MSYKNRKDCVVVCMLGARMHYAVPAVMAQSGLLHSFYTDTYISPNNELFSILSLLKRLPIASHMSLLRSSFSRYESSIPERLIHAFNIWGISLIIARNCFSSQTRRDRINLLTGRQFCKKILKKISWEDIRCIYAYRGVALEIFKAARLRGVTCILEQTIAPKRVEAALLQEEFDRWSEWQNQIDLGLIEKMAQREEAEWECADAITGASQFVVNGLRLSGVPEEKCHIVPYAVNQANFPYRLRDYDGKRPIRILFAGEAGLRKGIQYLYLALKQLSIKSYDCKIAGPVPLLSGASQKVGEVANCLGTVPKYKMPELFNWTDVFVLPSICEGSATVTYEAIACGVPVIATPNCGSIIRDGLDGFIVPIRDSEALAVALKKLIRSPDLIREMSRNAFERSRQFTWDKYGERLSKLVLSQIATSTN